MTARLPRFFLSAKNNLQSSYLSPSCSYFRFKICCDMMKTMRKIKTMMKMKMMRMKVERGMKTVVVKMVKGRTMIGFLILKRMNANKIIYVRFVVFCLEAIYERPSKSLKHYDPVEDIRSQGT